MNKDTYTTTTADTITTPISEWKPPEHPTYSVRVWVTCEVLDHQYYSKCYPVWAADLHGCRSEGKTICDAITNIREKFTAMILCYRAAGEAIPWRDGGERPLFAEERVLFIEVPEEETP